MLDGGTGRDRGVGEGTPGSDGHAGAGSDGGYLPQGAPGMDDEVPFAPQVL